MIPCSFLIKIKKKIFYTLDLGIIEYGFKNKFFFLIEVINGQIKVIRRVIKSMNDIFFSKKISKVQEEKNLFYQD